MVVAVFTFILLQFVTAPYGRHIQQGWGITISNKAGWIIMELPSLSLMSLPFLLVEMSNYALFLNVLWLLHYFNRTFIFLLEFGPKGKECHWS